MDGKITLDNSFIFDLEADGYLHNATKIWCFGFEDYQAYLTSTIWVGRPEGDVSELPQPIKDAITGHKYLVGHNIAGYDIPLLEKICGIDLSSLFVHGKVYDTYLASCILDPDKKSHSLAALAAELGLKKDEHKDFTQWSTEMEVYCSNDVSITSDIFESQLPRLADLGDAMQTEAFVAYIHAKQTLNGVTFDLEKADNLHDELEDKKKSLGKVITANLPELYTKAGTCKSVYKKDGSLSAQAWKAIGAIGINVDVARPCKYGFSTIKTEPVNLDSNVQVKKALLAIGWKPTTYTWKDVNTYATVEAFEEAKKKAEEIGKPLVIKNDKVRMSPQLTEDSYSSLPEDLGKLLKEYDMVSHRLNFLKGVLKKHVMARKYPNGAVEHYVMAEARTCATPTARYKHSGAVCNIPRPKTPYGEEIRSLYGVRQDRNHAMLGADLKQIEARMLLHYATPFDDDGSLANSILSNDKNFDFHSANARAWGVDRDTAKTGLYALMYGCGDAKLAESLNKPLHLGRSLRSAFWKANPAIRKLVDNLEEAYSRNGCLFGPDGRKLHIRGSHKLLNTLLQHSATLAFKKWMIDIYKELGLYDNLPYCQQIIAYHDELQFRLIPGKAKLEYYENRIKRCAKNQGLSWRVPIECDVKVGKNWSETH